MTSPIVTGTAPGQLAENTTSSGAVSQVTGASTFTGNSYDDPNETSSDSDEEVMRRYQQSMTRWPLAGQKGAAGVPPKGAQPPPAHVQQSIAELGRTVVKCVNDSQSTTGLLDDDVLNNDYREREQEGERGRGGGGRGGVQDSPDVVISSRPRGDCSTGGGVSDSARYNARHEDDCRIDTVSVDMVEYRSTSSNRQPPTSAAAAGRKASLTSTSSDVKRRRCVDIIAGSLEDPEAPDAPLDPVSRGASRGGGSVSRLGGEVENNGYLDTEGGSQAGSGDGKASGGGDGQYPQSDQAVSAESTSNGPDTDEHLFDIGDLQERESVPISKSGNLRVTFLYQTSAHRMTVTVHEATEIPSKERGGAHSTQVRLLLLPTKKSRHKTKIKTGDSPNFEETFLFKVPPEELSSMGVRLRLYGCERMRRERMIGECVVAFASVTSSLDQIPEGPAGAVPVTRWLTLEPRSNLSHGDSKADIVSLNKSDSGSSCHSMQHGGMPELMLGLGYNEQTGRLQVQVIKGSNFKNMAMTRAPDTYVKLTLMSPSGAEISRSKTSVRRGQPHPLFKETFMFQVPLFQLPDVTLMVSVFYNRSIKRKDMIGWFSLGYSNSSDEELSHWTDMRENNGADVCRWHVLLEP